MLSRQVETSTLQWLVGTIVGVAGVVIAYLQLRRQPSTRSPDRSSAEEYSVPHTRGDFTPTLRNQVSGGLYALFHKAGLWGLSLVAGRYAASRPGRRAVRVRIGAFIWCVGVAACVYACVLVVIPKLSNPADRLPLGCLGLMIWFAFLLPIPLALANALLTYTEDVEKQRLIQEWQRENTTRELTADQLANIYQLTEAQLQKYIEAFESAQKSGLPVDASHNLARKRATGCLALFIPLAITTAMLLLWVGSWF
jgi:hypothetical protein